jgi:effector-binding domain-containing protein
MKKVLRFIVILLLILIVGVVVLGLIAPKDVTVERSLTINAPTDAVFTQMGNFRNWEHWSPWYRADPTSKIVYSGEDGKAGSSYHWTGDPKKTGEGEMTATEINGTSMKYALHFLKPWEQKADGFIKAEDAGNGTTKASWGFSAHYPFPWNAMLVFMDMDKMLGKDFEAGLKNIKDYVEKNPAGSSAFKITETQFPGSNYAAIRKTISWSEMEQFFGDSYEKLHKAAGDQVSGAPAGIYYTWDEKNQKTDAAAAFPVPKGAVVKDATMIDVPGSRAYEIVYTGGYSGSMAAHDAMGKHIAAKGEKQHLVIEEYVKGPGNEKDSNKYVTNIYYLVH